MRQRTSNPAGDAFAEKWSADSLLQSSAAGMPGSCVRLRVSPCRGNCSVSSETGLHTITATSSHLHGLSLCMAWQRSCCQRCEKAAHQHSRSRKMLLRRAEGMN
jgi:hypothetical protein